MKLLEQTAIGGKKIKNSLAMAPMTGSRANMEGLVGE